MMRMQQLWLLSFKGMQLASGVTIAFEARLKSSVFLEIVGLFLMFLLPHLLPQLRLLIS